MHAQLTVQERFKSRVMRRNEKSHGEQVSGTARTRSPSVGSNMGFHGNVRMLLQAIHIVALSHPFEDASDDDFDCAFVELLNYCSH